MTRKALATNRRTLLLRRLALWSCLLLALLLQPQRGDAAQRPFTARFTANTNGDILLIGNTAMSCDPNAANCLNARNVSGGLPDANLNNNSYLMYYVDTAGNPAAASSTSAVLNMPAGSTVLWAGLYWGGESSAAARGSVQLQTPSSSVTVAASQVDGVPNVGCSNTCDRYSSFADVTNLVQVAGNGTYTVNGVSGYVTNAAVSTYAGWSLVVVLQNPAKPLRNLTVFDGLVEVGCSSPLTTSFPVSGFLTPYSGQVNTVLGVVAGEGDLGSYGDYIQLNGTKVGDGIRLVAGPSGDNFFMSANTDLGSYVSNNRPSLRNLLGWDIGRVQASGILANGSTSASISLGTANECYYPSVTSFMTDLYVPIVAPNIVKTAAKVGSGSLIPGDTLRFTINVGNTGIDPATKVSLNDLIPTWTTYKPGTLQVLSGANPGAKSDAAGNDQAEFCDSTTTPSCAQPQVVFRLGTGASGTTGGTLLQNQFTSISFDVTINGNIPSGTAITNAATVAYNGQTLTSTSFSNTTNQVQASVLTPPAVTKAFAPAVVNVGAGSAMSITLANPSSNAGTVSGVSFTDNYPAGLINDPSNPAPSITCSAGSTPGSLVGGGPGGTSIGMTGASILQNGVCTVTVNVKSNQAQSGNYLNSTGPISTSNAGSSGGASATLSVGLPTISQSIGTTPATTPAAIGTGGSASALFTLANQSATPLTGVGFSDPLPAGVTVQTGSLAASQCGGTVSYNAGSNTVSLAGGALAAASGGAPGTCSVAVPLTGSTPGLYTNTATGVTSAQTVSAGPASNSATLTVNAPPTAATSFAPASIQRGQDVCLLTITVANPNSVNAAGSSTITGVTLTDSYPTSPGTLLNSNNPLPALTCTQGSSATLTGGPPNGGSIGISNGSIAPGGSCTVTVYVTTPLSATPGNYLNSTGSVTTANAGTGAAAGATLNVSSLSAPATTVSFAPASVARGSASTLSIRLANANASAVTGVSFSDSYPSGLSNSGTPALSNSCGGTVTTVAGGTSLSLSGGTIPANGSCTITVQVMAAGAGAYFDSVPTVTTGNAGVGAQAGATLTVVDPPVIVKTFSPNAIKTGNANQGNYSTLTITVTNPDSNSATLTTLTGVAFTDTFPAGVVRNTNVAGYPTLTCSTGSSATLASGTGSVSISNGTLAPGGSCTVTARVSSSTAGTYTNTISNLTSGNGGNGNSTSDVLAVGHLGITKSFSPSLIASGTGVSTMTVTLTNARATGISNAAFTDNYPAGMTNAAAPAVTSNCGGTVSAPANGSYLSLTGGSINSGATCTITVKVAATGSADNIIPSGGFTGGGDANSDPAEAILSTYSPPGVVESFVPSSVGVGTPSVLTITISNPNDIAATGASFSDNYTGGLVNSGTPSATQSCSNGTTTGTLTAAAGTNTLTLSGATIPANGSCTITVNVTSPTPGTIQNQTGAVASSAIGTNTGGASASLTVLALPAMTKSFAPAQINANASSLLTVTLTNPNSAAITGAGFTDNYPATPAGLVNAAVPGAATSCLGGSVSASPGGTSLTLSGATIPASGSCTVTVNVTSAAVNSYTNTIASLATANAGTAAGASGTLTVAALPAPTVTESFAAPQILVNGSTTLTVTLQNNSPGTALSGVAFTDNLPAGLTILGTPTLSQCGGSVQSLSGGSVLQFSGGSVAAGGSCSISAQVTSAAAGGYTNSINAVTSSNAGTGGPASAVLSVVHPQPTATKSFTPDTMVPGGTSLLTITLYNGNPVAVTGVGTTDSYPSGLVNSGSVVSNSCGGSVDAPAGAGYLTLSNGAIPARGNCSVSINVTAAAAGSYPNSTGAISSANAATGTPYGPVTLSVVAPTLGKSFGTSPIPVGGKSTLTFSIVNGSGPNYPAQSGLGFTDNFPAGVVVANPPNLVNSCNGLVYKAGTTTALAGGEGGITFTGGSIPSSKANCSISIDVTSATPSSGSGYVNSSANGNVNSPAGGLVITGASATLQVVSAPTLAGQFGSSPILTGGSTPLTFTIHNTAAGTPTIAGIGFSDKLPTGLSFLNATVSGSNCGATPIMTLPDTLTLSGASVGASDCVVTATVTSTTPSSGSGYTNSSAAGNVTPSGGLDATGTSATLAVLAAPTLTKLFGAANPATMAAGGTIPLTLTIRNNASGTPPISGLGFQDALPSGLSFTSNPVSVSNCGGSAAVALTPAGAPTTITLTGGSVDSSSCVISATVTGSTAQSYRNSAATGTVTGSGGLDVSGADASLTVTTANPTLSKQFSGNAQSAPATIVAGQKGSLTFTINNGSGNPVQSGLGFKDVFTGGLVVANPPNLSNGCGGSITGPAGAALAAGDGTVILSGGSLAFGTGSCSISVDVTSAAVNSYPNSQTNNNLSLPTGGLDISNAAATLSVVKAPTLAKQFQDASILTGGNTTLSFTVHNTAAATPALGGLGFKDTLPAGLSFLNGTATTANCGAGASAVISTVDNSLTFSGGVGASDCVISTKVTSSQGKNFTNSYSGNISQLTGGLDASGASATLAVLGPPVVSTSFTSGTMTVAGTSTLTVQISNNNQADITGAAFTDYFPTTPGNLVAAGTPSYRCVNASGTDVTPTGSVSTPNNNSLQLTGGTIPAGGSCSVKVDVTAPAAGSYLNSTGAVTTGNAGSAAAASATVVAILLPAPTTTASFAVPTAGAGMPTALTIAVTNTSSSSALSNVAFSDTLPTTPGQMLAVSAPTLTNCGSNALLNVAPDNKSFSLSNASIAPGGTCTVKIDVAASVSSSTAYADSTSTVTSANAVNGNAAGASLTISGTTLSKRFDSSNPATVVAGQQSTLSFTLANGANTPAQGGLTFTDSFQNGLVVASPPNVVISPGSCGGNVYGAGTTTNVAAGDKGITFANGTMAFGTTACAISVDVTSPTAATYLNTSSNISSSTPAPSAGLDISGVAATLNVLAAPTLGMSFTPNLTGTPGNSKLSYTITNNASGNSFNGLGFVNQLPNNLNVDTSQTFTTSQCSGTLSYTTNVATNSSILTFTGGSLSGSSCTLTVPVTSGSTTGSFQNSYSPNILSTSGGLNATSASATLTVTSTIPTLASSFNPPAIGIGGSSTLTLTVTNATGNPAESGISFTDTLPANLTIVGNASATLPCTWAVNTANNNKISVSNQSLAQNAAGCTIVATVTSNVAGSYTNSTTNGNITLPNNLNITGAGDNQTLAVIKTTLAKTFMQNPVGPGQGSTLRFTIGNGSPYPAQTGLGFIDTLNSRLAATVSAAQQTQCGGTVGYDSGSNRITFSGGFLTGTTQSCTIDVGVSSATPGSYANNYAPNGNLSGAAGGLDLAGASDTLNVVQPTVTMGFGTNPVLVNTPSTMTITLSNANLAADITGVGFSEMLPATPGQMVIAATPGLSNTCGGTVTAVAGSTTLQLSGATIPHNGSCAVQVDVSAPTAGSYTDNLATVSYGTGATVGPFSAQLTVLPAPTVQVAQTSNNGIGTFSFAGSNGVAASFGIATVTAGTPALSAAYTVTSLASSVTLTQTPPAGWPGPASGSCNDANGTVSGNGSGSFGTLAGNVLTIASANLKPGAQIVCSFVTTAVATVTVTNALLPAGDSGKFNLLVGSTVVASDSGNAGSGTLTVAANAAVTVSETAGTSTNLSSYATGYSCSNGASGNGASVSVTPAPGQAVTCSFTNSRLATITIVKQSNNGTGNFSFTGGSNGLPATLTLDTAGGNPRSSAPYTVTALNTAASLTESASAGWVINSSATTCSDGSSSFGTLAGGTLTIPAANVSAGKMIACTFVNDRYAAPTAGKSFGSASVAVGGSTTLILTLANPAANPAAISTVRLDDSFPAGLTLLNTGFSFAPTGCGSVTSSSGLPSAAGDGNVRFSVPSLAPGASCQVSINVTGSTAGNITNTTGAPTAAGPTALSGSAASAGLWIYGLPLIYTTTTPVTPNAAPGQDVVYIDFVSNTGTGVATGVTVQDHLSPYVYWSLDYGTGAPFRFDDGAVASGLFPGAPLYSRNNGSTWDYTPASGAGGAPAGYDAEVTDWKVPMIGTMNASAAAPYPSFTIRYRVRVK
jgi:mucin-19